MPQRPTRILGSFASSLAGAKHVAAMALVLALALATAPGADKEKKPEEKPGPPRVILALPIALTAGRTNHVKVRGSFLAAATQARFTNVGAEIPIRARTKLEVPKDMDAKIVGDSQIELDIEPPAATAPATNYLVITSTNGTSAAHPILVMPAGALTAEKEPNGGLGRAQAVTSGTTVHGGIREDADVDMFRFEGKAGQWLAAEVRAARLGSALDAVLTLHSDKGSVLADSDDSRGRDALLRFRLPADGAYYLSLVDALNRGGPAYEYLLELRLE